MSGRPCIYFQWWSRRDRKLDDTWEGKYNCNGSVPQQVRAELAWIALSSYPLWGRRVRVDGLRCLYLNRRVGKDGGSGRACGNLILTCFPSSPLSETRSQFNWEWEVEMKLKDLRREQDKGRRKNPSGLHSSMGFCLSFSVESPIPIPRQQLSGRGSSPEKGLEICWAL